MEPVTERERHTMLTTLDELMGSAVASTLIRHLPPGGWADVATKHDLVQLEDRLTHRMDTMLAREFGTFRDEMRTELHGELGSLRSELHDGLGSLRSELHDGLGSLRSDLYGEIGQIRTDMQAMTRTYILGNVGLVFTVAAIAFGSARLV